MFVLVHVILYSRNAYNYHLNELYAIRKMSIISKLDNPGKCILE